MDYERSGNGCAVTVEVAVAVGVVVAVEVEVVVGVGVGMNVKQVALRIEALAKTLGDVDISGCESHVWDDIAHIQLEMGSLVDRLNKEENQGAEK